jgi:HAD superfamily hydrolase (TIGR01490 family)
MKAAFFDVDGTLTETRVWNGLMDYFKVHRAKVGVNVLFQSFHYFLYFLYLLRLMPQVRFREIWAKNLSWYLKGFTVEQAAEIWDWVVRERIAGQWRSEIVSKLKAHHLAGDATFLVSGGPEGLLSRIALEIGADYVVGTRHVVENGIYTGDSPADACQGEKKVILAKKVFAEQGLEIDLTSSFAYADSLGDLDLLEMVGHPVAVYPDEHLRPVAIDRGWTIIE